MATTSLDAGSYGVNDMMRNGPSNVLSGVVSAHPLQSAEKNFHLNEEKRMMNATRNIHGMHMPIRLGMEKAVASKIRRLPGMQSSNLAMRTLLGTTSTIGPEDVFNDVSDKYDGFAVDL